MLFLDALNIYHNRCENFSFLFAIHLRTKILLILSVKDENICGDCKWYVFSNDHVQRTLEYLNTTRIFWMVLFQVDG